MNGRNPVGIVAGLSLALVLGCQAGGGAATDPGLADVAVTPDVRPEIALPSPAELLAPGSHGVGLATLDLKDPSRPTPANGAAPATPDRRLPTLVWYPADPTLAGSLAEHPDAKPDRSGGPWPLIVYCHGFNSFSRENDWLAAILASRGFVVAAPEFPLTHFGTEGQCNATDVLNQPGDVRFVLDQVLARVATPGDALEGLVDPSRVGLFGVSLGGLTAILTAFPKGTADARIKAVGAAAAPGCYLPDDFFAADLPLLLVHGTLDAVVPYDANAPLTFAAAKPPKFLVTLDKGTHTGLGGVGVASLDNLDNPDLLGCSTVKDNPSVQPEVLASLSASFGGLPHDEALAACPAICGSFEDLPPGMKASREVELLYLATVAFFEEVLGNQPWGLRFLEEELPRTGKDVTVKSAF